MEKRASIDIGSNSILLLVAEIDGDSVKVLENESHVTGLGRDLDLNKKFIQEAMDDSLAVLEEYSKICKKYEIEPATVLVTATEASRVATNAAEFFEQVKQRAGFNIQTISAEGEAYYSATGILFDKHITNDVITIMDIGGASTELIKVNTKDKSIIHSFSMPVGAVRMNNWAKESKREENLAMVLQDFNKDLEEVLTSTLYCVAGTMTSVANMYLKHSDFVESEVNGLSFAAGEVNKMLQQYNEYTPDRFLSAFPFLGKRSKTIKSGLILANTILHRLKIENVYISTYGLRYGTLLAGEINHDFLR